MPELRFVADVPDDRDDRVPQEFDPVEEVERLGFVDVESDDFGRGELQNGPDELRPDRPRRARDENAFPVQEFPDGLKIDRDGRPAQEVFDLDLLNVLQGDILLHPVDDAREDLDLPPPVRFAEEPDDLADVLGCRGRHGNEGLVDLELLHDRRDGRPRPQDLIVLDDHSLLGRIVVDVSDGEILGSRVGPHLPGDLLPGRAGADDQDPDALIPDVALPDPVFADRPLRNPQSGKETQGEEEIEEKDRARKGLERDEAPLQVKSNDEGY